ncbi:MAG: pirin family protein [Acaryochloris sp. RU_4_1]|nr:pirin family protein [Acaryochloris sp. RU_4_1]NJR53920.1 pirin family protein [Acaryochloris sp. CRU_2_0]
MSAKILQKLTPHLQDLGGFTARRLLPHGDLAMVGPFIFFDHLGPATFPPGKGVDVRPHPHINLATVTYLFEGALLHRDSLGSVQEIHPGAVNWMTAGRGIVHSERSSAADRETTSTLHAIQTWVALPEEHEETKPTFHHHPADSLPQWQDNGVTLTLIAGSADGHTSPVKTFSPILYLDLSLPVGSSVSLPVEYSERAVYSVTSGLQLDSLTLEPHCLAVLASGESISLSAATDVRCVVIGGEPVGQRHKWWNFVSSRLERIEQAKEDWQAGRFAKVPDETEFIPLPDA